jgi:hypothetical protein
VSVLLYLRRKEKKLKCREYSQVVQPPDGGGLDDAVAGDNRCEGMTAALATGVPRQERADRDSGDARGEAHGRAAGPQGGHYVLFLEVGRALGKWASCFAKPPRMCSSDLAQPVSYRE